MFDLFLIGFTCLLFAFIFIYSLVSAPKFDFNWEPTQEVPLGVPIPNGGQFDFNWEPTQEVGPLGAEYGLQPPGISIPKNFNDLFKSNQQHPDLDF